VSERAAPAGDRSGRLPRRVAFGLAAIAQRPNRAISGPKVREDSGRRHRWRLALRSRSLEMVPQGEV